MLTRLQQRQGNPNGNEQKGDNTEVPEPEEVMKKPAAKAKSKAKAKASPKVKSSPKAKAKAKGKAKAKAAPKEKSQPKPKTSQVEAEKSPKTPKRRLFQSDEEDGDEVPITEQKGGEATSSASEAVKPQGKKGPATGPSEPKVDKAAVKEKQKPQMKRPAAAPKTKKPDGEVDAEPKPKKKARRSSKKDEAALPDMEEDEVMKAVFMQVFKDSRSLAFDEFKAYLNAKKPTLTSGNVQLNVYWTKSASACRLLAVGPPSPDAAYFHFKLGSWNARMAACFMSSVLMVAGLGISEGGLEVISLNLVAHPLIQIQEW